ncbi:Phosphomethylpyrimidine kinase-domain-containing protein [Vararia minispora EC-137]|uniref:Phosphomethylpyrimidine kinase-domain-containing protein n=1 Tax=Vararia minispora EC-137 TaxID=1314806 RepID=A0ACB8QU01_9AGAM|nr:Phosphomethylpyrimidine kinase-domain-containing protein [Vararia minispora EC-137]
MSELPAPPAVLTIAGSDPSGGAGIQADLKTFAACGCYGMAVLTALTAQNTTGVQGVHAVPPAFVEQQLESVLTDIPPRALKTGMLYDRATVVAVASALRAAYPAREKMPPLVVDPVCVSTSGHQLLDSAAVDALAQDLMPLAVLVTPNTGELALLLGPEKGTVRSLADLRDGARALAGPCESEGPAVLLKGGHLRASLAEARALADADLVFASGLPGENMEVLYAGVERRTDAEVEVVVDVLRESGGRETLFVSPRIESTSTHGTGCTLSAAIACSIAQGQPVRSAVHAAIRYTHGAIASATPYGAGYGPLNHAPSLMLFPRATRADPRPFVRWLIESCRGVWKAYVEHEFVKKLGEGTLRRECFVHFLRQDYLYLKYYARAHGLLVAKSSAYSEFGAAAAIVQHVARESQMHVAFCAEFGVGAEELESTRESPACTAYGAYILDVGLRGDRSALQMALAACLIGYGEVGLWLRRQSWAVLEGNAYRRWIEDYSGDEYQGAVRVGIERLESMAAREVSCERITEWREVWERCATLEKQFWDMGLDLS